MGEYVVSIDNEEKNEIADVISITGRVFKANVAAKVRISAIKGLSATKQKKEKQKALVEAYENMLQEVPEKEGEVVIM